MQVRNFTWWVALGLLATLVGCGPKLPDWTRGQSELYPEKSYLLGVGIGPDRGRAEDRARAEIAKIFEVEIRSQEASSEIAWISRLGEDAQKEYRQTAQAQLTATTNKVLQGVRIAEVWQDQEQGTFYALATLDRQRTAMALRSELSEVDQEVAGQVQQGDASDSPLRKLGHYMQALESLERRKVLATDLRIVDPAGFVMNAPHSAASVSGRAERTAAKIRLGIDLQGDGEGIVKGALVKALAGIGMQLAPPWEQNLLLKGKVTVQEQVATPWYWNIASAQVEFLQADGSTFDSMRVSAKEGSRFPERSQTLAMERLGQKLAAGLLDRIGRLGLVGR